MQAGNMYPGLAAWRALLGTEPADHIPFRVGLQSMAALDPAGDSYWRAVARIKAALDPLGRIAPGRCQPRAGD
jgi:4-cresol dehydrogenase (hydroxylating)